MLHSPLDVGRPGLRRPEATHRDRSRNSTTTKRRCRCGKECEEDLAFKLRNNKCDDCYNRSMKPYMMCVGIPSSTGETLRSRDLLCLKEGEMLNDKILQHFLQKRFDEVLCDNDRENVQLFDTLFVEKILNTDCEVASPSGSSQDKSVLFFPVFLANHFSLVVYFRQGVALRNFPGGATGRQIGYFLHMDPCVGYHDTESILKKLEKFVDKYYCDLQVHEVQFQVNPIILDLPQQTNVVDCGCYVLMYFEYLVQYCKNYSWSRKSCVIPYDDIRYRPVTLDFYKRIDAIGLLEIKLLRVNMALDLWKSNKELFSYKIHMCEQSVIELEDQIEKDNLKHPYSSP